MAESWTPAEERAARGIAARQFTTIPWGMLSARTQDGYRGLARAALSAAAEGPEPEWEWGVRYTSGGCVPRINEAAARKSAAKGHVRVVRRLRGPWEVVDGE